MHAGHAHARARARSHGRSRGHALAWRRVRLSSRLVRGACACAARQSCVPRRPSKRCAGRRAFQNVPPGTV
eukprot:5093407-Pleurochrysis_carterae.AAC.1